MDNKILDFIHRRFPQDSKWCEGNCYFFSVILSTAFEGSIWYDPVAGHFVFKWSEDNQFYDWTGVKQYTDKELSKLVDWSTYEKLDSTHYNHIMKYCAT